MNLVIRLFTPDDVSAALKLCRSAGWNQLGSDWLRLVRYQPDGCFLAEIDGKLVGTVTSTSYGQRLAWIGMMLVDPGYRRRGIATELMRASLDYLRGQRIGCIKLDATPAGQPVYERLGFVYESSFHRWQCDTHESSANPEWTGDDQDEFPLAPHASLDLGAFGADRLDWLTRLSRDSVCTHDSHGFGMIRRGHLATYLGPVTADCVKSAEQIIRELLAPVTGKVFWDVPPLNKPAVELAKQLGFAPVRDLARMRIGRTLEADDSMQFAICDPGTG